MKLVYRIKVVLLQTGVIKITAQNQTSIQEFQNDVHKSAEAKFLLKNLRMQIVNYL